jgi:hypothetical protein
MKAHKKPSVTNIYKYLYKALKVTYLFEAIWEIKHLDLTSYNKICPDLASLGAFLAFSKVCEGLWGTPDQYF